MQWTHVICDWMVVRGHVFGVIKCDWMVASDHHSITYYVSSLHTSSVLDTRHLLMVSDELTGHPTQWRRVVTLKLITCGTWYPKYVASDHHSITYYVSSLHTSSVLDTRHLLMVRHLLTVSFSPHLSRCLDNITLEVCIWQWTHVICVWVVVRCQWPITHPRQLS